MLKKLNPVRNKKGFTLVELIVVLVILAILAAILIPTLTGYVDKANQRTVMAEARSALMACQTLASEDYAQGTTTIATWDGNGTKPQWVTDAEKLAEVPTGGAITSVTVAGGKITSLKYTNSGHTATYTSTDANKWVVS